MPHYETVIAKYTKLNPTHVETYIMGEVRTLNSLSAADFKRFCAECEQIGAAQLAEWHEMEVA